MSLFKRLKEKKKPTKEELNSFKLRLKVGDDPMEHFKKKEEYWDKYTYHKETMYDLLRKLYKVQDVSMINHYEKIEVWLWSGSGDCKVSPIGKHVYINHYGDDNPKKDDEPVCLACEKELKL